VNQIDRIFLLGFMAGCSLSLARAQSISDCEGAITLCGDLYTETDASFNSGAIQEFTGICNQNLEQSSVWYSFTVQEDGLLSFILDPLNPMDDYDWGLFDITTGGCEGIGTALLSPEVGCNSYGVAPPEPNGATGISTTNGGTGSSNGPGNFNGPPFNADLPVQAGETYALVVMNWTNSLEGYEIDFGQSTASLYDDSPPLIDSVQVVDCELTSFDVFLDEYVNFLTVTAEDFELVGPTGSVFSFSSVVGLAGVNGYNEILRLTLDGAIDMSGSYTLHITDAAGSIADACGNLGEGFAEVELTVLDPPLGWDELEVLLCPDDAASLSVNSVVQQPENTAYTYIWAYDLAGAPTIGTGPGIETMGDGVYDVTISTSPPCYSASGSFHVITEECSLTIPNVITPANGDALNNAFLVDGLDQYPGSKVHIYNRWGEMVYTSENFGATAGWDPTSDQASEGTYYYILRILRGQDEVSVIDAAGETLYPADGNPYLELNGSFALMRQKR
jgi:gliding motility-associated-like protein